MSFPPATPPPPLFVSTEVVGPPHQAPLFLSDTNTVTLFTNLSFFTPSSVDGKAYIEGTNESYINAHNKNNLTWQVPDFVFDAGMDIKVWNSLAFFTTLKIDNSHSQLNFAGFDVGVGLIIYPVKNFSARLDLGYTYLSTDMDAKLVRINSNSDTSYFNTANNKKTLDPFVSLTMSTAFEDWIVNPFFQASYCRQELFSISSSSYNYSSSNNLYTLTPGVTYRVNDNILIVIGGSYFMLSDIENASSEAIYSGFLQANFLLERN
jgi:hypothetical protein